MTDPCEVIAAFADGERVDAGALGDALATPDGRAYLVDLVALREVVQAAEPGMAAAVSPRPSRIRWLAAAVVLAVVGGGLFLTTREGDRPPEPTHVIKLERGIDWRGN